MILIADFNNDRIRKVNVNGGQVTTIAGGGSSDTGAALSTKVQPYGISCSPSVGKATRCFYTGYYKSRWIYEMNMQTGQITRTVGSTSGSSRDGVGTNVYISQPLDITCDSIGGRMDLYIVSERTIRKVNVNTLEVTTLVGVAGAAAAEVDGTGPNVRLLSIESVTMDSYSSPPILYLCHSYGHNKQVRSVQTDTGEVKLLAGYGAAWAPNRDGAATFARFSAPAGISFDYQASVKTLYVGDTTKLRKLFDSATPNAPPPTNIPTYSAQHVSCQFHPTRLTCACSTCSSSP